MNPPALDETRAALRREIGPSTHRDHRWQPMVSAGEIRQLLDALDESDREARLMRTFMGLRTVDGDHTELEVYELHRGVMDT